MPNWKVIHPDFTTKDHWEKKTYQQKWEEAGFDYEEAKQWIEIDFKPDQLNDVQEWKKLDFDYQQVKEWMKTGLGSDEHEFAYYLIQNDYNPLTVNLSENRSRIWLDWEYPSEKRGEVTEVNSSSIYFLIRRNLNLNLTGSLNLNSFVNLRELTFNRNKINSLDVSNCENLTKINFTNNQLTTLLLPKKGKKLTSLNLSDNRLTGDLSIFSLLINLNELNLANNSLAGSLEPLQSLSKLQSLNISNTDINQGLEYLPETLCYICCSSGDTDNVSCRVIEKQLEEYEKTVKNGDNYYDYQAWAKDNLWKILKRTKQRLLEKEEELVEKEQNIQSLNSQLRRFKKNNLEIILQNKFNELNEIKKNIIERNKLNDEIEEQVQELLEEQEKFGELQIKKESEQFIAYAEKQLNKAKKRLNKVINVEETNLLCQKQEEITKIKEELGQLEENSVELLIQQIEIATSK